MQELTNLTPAVHLTDPLASEALEPVPSPGCVICAALGRQREQARMWNDFTTVTDCNVEIRRHPHKKQGRVT